jgi:two-component system response regulator AtoC
MPVEASMNQTTNEERFHDDYPTAVSSTSTHRPIIMTAMVGNSVITYPLPPRGPLTIGRGRECTIRIDEPSISRLHATLHVGPEMLIEDMGSTNGVHVRGYTLEAGQTSRIRVCEPFELGTVTLVLFPASTSAEGAVIELHETSSDEARPWPPSSSPPDGQPTGQIVVIDPKMAHLHALAKRVAGSNISILLLGETGCGKEVLAEIIHQHSLRRRAPLLRINCAELAENLLESELFGHEKGAFSGATGAKPGLLEASDGGTIFLDELGEMPLNLQTKLLRVIEERMVRRIGGLKSRSIDVRFVAATNLDLKEAALQGRFRADLYYRLNGVSLVIPPLRTRRAEIPSLARLFVERFSHEIGRRHPPYLGAEALALLNAHSWPGNIRELRNVIQRSVLMSHDADEIRAEHMLLDGAVSSAVISDVGAPSTALHQRIESPPFDASRASPEAVANERARIVDALARCAGNQTHAAKLLGMGRTRFIERLEEYALPRPRSRKQPW